MAASAASSPRFGHIDNLRAVAAGLVMWTHLAENFAPRAAPDADGPVSGVVHRLPPMLNLGHTGVVIFFCISGFVIYGSLARRGRENAGRRFALGRFFRLFPAYWVSGLLGLIVLWWIPGMPTPWAMLVANAAMVSGLCGQPRVLGLYWTLETELVFYACCWALYRTGAMRSRWTLPGLILALMLLWTRMHLVMLWTQAHGWKMSEVVVTLPRHIAVMLWGALCREAHEQTGGFRHGLHRSGRTLLAVMLVAWIIYCCAPDSWHAVWRTFVRFKPTVPKQSVPYVIAPVVFGLWIVGPRVDWRPLRWLGEVSYSLYLFHPIVSGVMSWATSGAAGQGWPLVAYLLIGAAGTVAVSAGVYYAVERPAIRLGARLAEGRPVGEAETPFKTVAP